MRSYSNLEAVLPHTGGAPNGTDGPSLHRSPCRAGNPPRTIEPCRPVPHGG